MHEQERMARNLEAESTRLILKARILENEDDGQAEKIGQLIRQALEIHAQAVKIREEAGLPHYSPIEEYREFLQKHSVAVSGKETKSPYGFWATRHSGM